MLTRNARQMVDDRARCNLFDVARAYKGRACVATEYKAALRDVLADDDVQQGIVEDLAQRVAERTRERLTTA